MVIKGHRRINNNAQINNYQETIKIYDVTAVTVKIWIIGSYKMYNIKLIQILLHYYYFSILLVRK